ncbi:MAG TPA: hypothetical protein VKY26_02355 [Actinomycetota bacterium]|nr:hypothetical protein [Actinomycetota bacterium]
MQRPEEVRPIEKPGDAGRSPHPEPHPEAGDYNLTATFPDVATAKQAAGALRLRGLAGEAIALGDAADVPAVDEARMRDELEGSAGIATRSMLSGAFAGGVIGLVIGAVVGFLVGLAIFGSGVGEPATVVGLAVGLSVAGAVIGGFAKPRVDPAATDVPASRGGAASERVAKRDVTSLSTVVPPPSPQGVVLQVHVTDPELFAEAEDVLVHAGPLRVDRFTESGQVVGTEELGLDAPPVQPGSGRQFQERSPHHG